ncbi:MAG: glycosyltransferase family 39 protein [Anaerolineales bacterium]|nr:glycosyltransferase family 39 protein [Anaerolineales bacterium]
MTNEQPEKKQDSIKIRRLIALLGIVLLLLSQLLLASEPLDESFVFPRYTWLTVTGLVLFLSSLLIRPTLRLQRIAALFLFRDEVFWILTAAAFSGLAAVGAALYQRNYIPVLSIWLTAGFCYLFTFVRGVVSTEKIRAAVKDNRNELLIVAAIAILALTLRFYRLGEVPRVLDGDEGLIGLAAQSTVDGRLANPFALWENFGALYLQLINAAFRIFGESPFALRLAPAIGGALGVIALYLLARQIGGRKIALIAAILLALSHTHIHFSRIVSVAYVHGAWLAPLELYFLYSGLEKRQAWRSALGGILLAVNFSIYLTAQVIVGLALVYMLIAFIFHRSWFKAALPAALAFWGGFMVMILPEALYISRHPDEFLNRLSQDGVFQSGWLTATMQSTGQSAVTILFERIIHAFMSLVFYPAIDFYGSPSPMLTVVSSVLFLVGLGIALFRVRQPAYLLLNGYFWGTTVAVGVFAIPPSADSYRMLMAFPAALILCAIGLDQILETLGIGWETARNVYVFSTASVLIGLLILNVWIYYGDFAGQCRFGGNLESRFASYLGTYAKTVESESNIYLLSDPIFFYGSHASTDFLSQRRPIVNHADSLDVLNPISGETIIANPDRIAELENWIRLNPGGEIHYEYDCKRTILMAYQLP